MSKKHYIIPIFVPHEGCPFDCVFCNQKKITGIGTRITSDEVNNIIEKYIKTINIHSNKEVEIAFFGGSFTGISKDKQNELLYVANKWYKKGYINDIRISTRPDYINKEILENLKKFNVSIIELGVQSLDDEVLKKSNRGHLSKDVLYASKLIKDFGFKLGLQMMVGLPGDNAEKSIDTAKKIITCNPDFVRIYPTLVIKGTALEVMYLTGKYSPLTLNEAVNICKKLYKIFISNNIKIIRIGLQPTDNIMEGKDIIAGPFHPSFRQLVVSSLFRDKIVKVFSKFIKEINEVIFIAHPKNISFIVGNKKKNIIFFKDRFNVNKIKIYKDISLSQNIIKVIADSEKEFTIKIL